MIKINFIEAKKSDLNTLLEIYNYYLINTTTVFDYKKIDIHEFKSRISFNKNIVTIQQFIIPNTLIFCKAKQIAL